MLLKPGVLECVTGARPGTAIVPITFLKTRLLQRPQMGHVPDRGVSWRWVPITVSTQPLRGGSEGLATWGLSLSREGSLKSVSKSNRIGQVP